MYRGVFWMIDNEIAAFPFDGNIDVGVAKSGNTYNHRLLWDAVLKSRYKKAFDYYPRGRVEINASGKAVIYMNQNISEENVKDICKYFEVDSEPIVKYDHSKHYKCHLDWEREGEA